jgi:hypothetical protein
MAGAKNFTFRLTAEGVEDLRKDLEALGASGTAVFNKLAQAAPGLGDGLTAAQQRISDTRAKLESLRATSELTGAAFEALTKGAALFGIGLSIDGLIEFAKRSVENVGALKDLSTQLGVSAKDLQVYQYAARQSGVANDALRSGIANLTRQIGDAVSGNRAAIDLFNRLGIAFKDAEGNARDTGAVALDLADRIKESASAAQQAAIAHDALGRSGKDLLPIFADGAEGVRKFGVAAKEAGEVFSDDMIERLNKADQTFKNIGAHFEIVAAEIVAALVNVHNNVPDGQEYKRFAFAANPALDGLKQKTDALTASIAALYQKIGEIEQGGGSDAFKKNLVVPLEQQISILQGQIATLREAAGQAALPGNLGKAGHSASDGSGSFTYQSASSTADQKKALDDVIAGLQRDAELAALSGKAHAERQAVLQAEAAAEKDYAAGLRDKNGLTDEERAKVIAAADAAYDHADALKQSQQAQQDAERAAKEHAKAVEGATAAINDQISTLGEEVYELGLSDKERFIRQQLLQAEAAALKGNTQLTQDQIDTIKAEAAALFDGNQQIQDRQKAEQDATRAADEESRKREQIAQREAELSLEPFKNAIQGIQSDWTDLWKSLFSGDLLKDSQSFFDKFKQQGLDAIAQLLSAVTLRPALGFGLNAIGQDQLAASLGLQNITGPQAQAAAQNAQAGGSFSLASLVGANSGIGSWLNSLLGGSSTNASGFRLTGAGPGASAAGALPSWASFLNGGVGTGLIGAALSAGLTAATGGSGLQTALSGGGALLGGIVGSIIPGVGTIAGSAAGGFLGNIISSLFGGSSKPPRQKSITGIVADPSGLFGVGGTSTSHTGDVTSQLGQSAVTALNAFLASIGGTVTGPLPGQNAVQFYGRTPRYGSTVGGVSNFFGDDQQGAEDAVADFISRTLIAAIKSNKLDGVSQTVKTAIQASGASSADALSAAVAFAQFYDRVDQIRTPAQSAAKAVADLTTQLAQAKSQAEQYGLDASKIPGILKANFNDDIASQLEQLKDPTQYALDQLDIQKAAAIAQAQQLGADINAVEELYGLKRQQIVAQGLQGVTDQFQQFFNGLLTDSNLSALSPQAQYAAAKAQYQAAVASGDASTFTGAASQLLNVSRSYYASSAAYAADFKQVLSDTQKLGGLTTPIPAFASGNDNFAGGMALVGENGPELVNLGPSRIFDAQTTAAILSAANADFDAKGAARLLKALGQFGDTELIHVNPDEYQDAIRAWGPAKINPADGLPSFFGDEGGGGLGGGGYGGAGPSGGDKNGGTHGGNSGNSGNGGVQGKNGPIGPGGSIAAAAAKGDASAKAAQKAQEGKSNGSGAASSGTGSLLDKIASQTSSLANPAVNPGNPNLGLSGPGYPGPVGNTSGVDASNPANAPGLRADRGGGGWDSSFGPAPASAMDAGGFFDASKVVGSYASDGSVNALKNGPVDLDKFMHDWADYQGIQYGDVPADTIWDQIGNFFASMFGFNETNPLTDPNYNGPGNPAGFGADWSWDPAGLIGSIIGMAAGLPFGGGFLADKASQLMGRPLAINLGPDVTAGVSNALSAQGASGISLGATSVQANSTLASLGPQPGGIVASPDVPRSPSAALVGSQNSVAGAINAGLERNGRGTEATNALLQNLITVSRDTNDKIGRLLSTQATTNDVLQVQARGSRKV